MLPSARFELAILRFVRMSGAERWRTTNLLGLATSVKISRLERRIGRSIVNARPECDVSSEMD